MEFIRHTLTNGIRCIYKRIKSPVAYTALTVNAGSRDEAPKAYGAAHFTEHLLFKGTLRRRPHHINNRLEKLGGELNAFTTKEETVVHATSLKGDWAKAADLVADVVFRSTFPEKEICREREVILDEINSYKDSPVERIYDEFEDLLFEGSDLGHNILGTRASVSRMSGDRIREFTSKAYNTDQMVFSFAGNVTEKNFVRTVQKYFGDIPGSCRGFQRVAPESPAVFDRSVSRGTYQAHCVIGARAYSYNDPKRVPLALLVNILGGPAANSRLNDLLREKHGLTYNIEAGYTSFCDSGIATVYFGTDKDKTDICCELVHKVLKDVRERQMSARELSSAKKQLIGQLAIANESNENYILGAAKSYLVYGDVDSRERVNEKIRNVTPSQIMEVANEVFADPSRLVYR